MFPTPLSPRGRSCLLGLAGLLLLAAPAAAQQPRPLRAKVDKVEIGFQGLGERGPVFKTGLWAPVYVTLIADKEGNMALPVRADGVAHGLLVVEAPDSDGAAAAYTVPFQLGDGEKVTVVTYAKVAGLTAELRARVIPEGQDSGHEVPPQTSSSLPLQKQLYVALGARLPEIHNTLLRLNGKKANDPNENFDTGNRAAAFETDPRRLPDRWFGYEGVDLLILTTDSDPFLKGLEASPARQKAIAEWVRRGGRLLVSVSWRNQDRVSRLLAGPAWLPPLPAGLVPPDRQAKLTSVTGLLNFSEHRGAQQEFKGVGEANPLTVPRLQPGKTADVLIEQGDVPLMVRVPYGLGSVTLLAIDLDKAPFSAWTGNTYFWRSVLDRLAPPAAAGNPDMMADQWGGPGGKHGGGGEDVLARLHRELDNFDVPVISFGWVALFILIYIVIVGPLDYLILKHVFKRLEWTWITFPAVVLLVSVVAYFTAYAVKGSDLKVNQIDLVDIDLRTDLDEQYRPRKAYAYGTTWFAILSPRIQSYTVGVEPALKTWAGEGTKPAGEVLVDWMGRNDPYGPGSVGRQRSTVLMSRSYRFAPDATGMVGVPIPVWTTRAFAASWDVALPAPPIEVDLGYKPGDPDQHVTGTIKSKMPEDLRDLCLFYDNKAYPLEGVVLSARGDALPVRVEPARGVEMNTWMNSTRGWSPRYDTYGRRSFDAAPAVGDLFFQELTSGLGRNHASRRLDQTWRVREVDRREGQARVRDAVLVGRLARAEGPAEQILGGNDPRLASHLWLGDLPGEGKARPGLSGTLNAETYVRVLVALRPR